MKPPSVLLEESATPFDKACIQVRSLEIAAVQLMNGKDFHKLRGPEWNLVDIMIGMGLLEIQNGFVTVKHQAAVRSERRLENMSIRRNSMETPMLWDELTNDGWMIVGMNHYRMAGERHLFCSMAKDGRCIVAEGVDEWQGFESLKEQSCITTKLRRPQNRI